MIIFVCIFVIVVIWGYLAYKDQVAKAVQARFEQEEYLRKRNAELAMIELLKETRRQNANQDKQRRE